MGGLWDSEACSRKGVEVRFFSSAPNLFQLLRDGKHGAIHLSLLFRHLKLRFNSCGTRHVFAFDQQAVQTLSVRSEFISAITGRQSLFGLELSDNKVEGLADYFELVLEQNPFLHLVAPCSAEEFAVRHILESLTLLEYLPQNAHFADVGTGAGLPSIPCMIVRDDLGAVLIESKEKKTRFLESTVAELGIADRVEIINRQFSETTLAGESLVTCRAIDRFVDVVPRLLKWGKGRSFAFFGGPAVGEALIRSKVPFTKKLIPYSDQRFIYFFEH